MPKRPPLILLVEDEPDLRDSITDVIEEAGLRLEVTANYAEGAMLLNAPRPALLIANLRLPGGGDGHRLAELARRLGVPTLLISGHPEVIAEEGSGDVAFLEEPFRLEELLRVIRALIEDPF